MFAKQESSKKSFSSSFLLSQTGEYGLQCYVDEEVETALTSLVGCAMKLEGLGLGPGDECQAMEALSPCLMHIVDE